MGIRDFHLRDSVKDRHPTANRFHCGVAHDESQSCPGKLATHSAKALLFANSPAEDESLENPSKPDRLKFNQRPSFA